MSHNCLSRDISETSLDSDGGRGAESILDEIDGVSPDASKPPELAVAVAELVRQIIKPKNARATALRFIAFSHHISPDCIGQSITKSAKQLGVTKAALSKTGLAILAQFKIPSRYHKGHRARHAYRETQLRLVRAGRHASDTRRKRKLAHLEVDNTGKVYASPQA